MAEQHELFSAHEISNRELANCFAEGEEFYHKHIIKTSVLDLLGVSHFSPDSL
jgi:hypothetical protein